MPNIEMKITGHTIPLSGDINIGTVIGAHAELDAALRGHDKLIVSIDTDASFDLCGVQLIESARRTALEAGGTLALAEPAAGGLLETLRRGGFLQTADQCAFWLNTSGEQ